jgi:endo-1,4-beta-xylanase
LRNADRQRARPRSGCTRAPSPPPAYADRSLTADQATPPLKEAFKGSFLTGPALNPPQFAESDTRYAALVKAQFNYISPDDVLKRESVHPRPERCDFDLPDKYVAFGEKDHMFVVGHTLVWHQQTPKWVFEDAKGKPADSD